MLSCTGMYVKYTYLSSITFTFTFTFNPLMLSFDVGIDGSFREFYCAIPSCPVHHHSVHHHSVHPVHPVSTCPPRSCSPTLITVNVTLTNI